MSFLRKAVGGLASQLMAAGGETVDYFFGDYRVGLTAIKGDTEIVTESFSGQYEQTKTSDWIFRGSDLIVGGEEVAPREGDLIQHGDDVYEVLPVSNRKPWTYVDPYKTLIRVHTLLKETYRESSY